MATMHLRDLKRKLGRHADKTTKKEFNKLAIQYRRTQQVPYAVANRLIGGDKKPVTEINLMNDSTTFMWAESIEFDLRISERENDEDVTEFLRKLLQEIDENDWTQNVLITLISDAGTRTFAVEAGGSQESLRAVAEEFIG